ncbi:hypothetical protein ACT1UH_00075 [Mycoplasma sp. 332]|uniref:hypothetical protein n=1 Tax=Mycoplasma sp. 332 TaxID=3458236 RepID=UPI0040372ECD
MAIKHEVSRFTVFKIKKSINFDRTFNVSHKNKGNKYKQKFSDDLVDSKIEKIRDFSSFIFDQPTDRTRNVTMAIYYRTKGSIMSLKTLYRRTLKKRNYAIEHSHKATRKEAKRNVKKYFK